MLSHESGHVDGTWRSHTRIRHAEGHIRKVETTRCASRGVIIEREVPVTICITPRGSNVSWVEHIAVDEGDLIWG